MLIFLILFLFFLGLTAGSFLNVLTCRFEGKKFLTQANF